MRILGTGVDITECVRIAEMIDRHGETFIRRVFTDAEVDYCGKYKQPVERYSGRWAAKEATLKALGTGWSKGIAWTDVEVVNEATGKPVLSLHGAAAAHARSIGVDDLQISISHCSTHAVAFVTASTND
jgi:holo-[acyl-carrier protein] synthase